MALVVETIDVSEKKTLPSVQTMYIVQETTCCPQNKTTETTTTRPEAKQMMRKEILAKNLAKIGDHKKSVLSNY